jgi:cyclohexa-1,5-dienecarbonyl-CoA hydratase
MNETGPLRVEPLDEGAIWHVRLARPKANILDMEMTDQLSSVFSRAAEERRLKAVVIEGQGPNFSFGASVEEHLPGSYERMIPGFHGLFHRMLDSAVTTLAVVRGRCLGGGLELAAFCHRVFAAPDARFGQPEIVLGVVAPVASVILTGRVGRGRAEELCLSGRSYDAHEALTAGLIDQVDDDPSAAALGWAREYLLPRSSTSLRFAVRAARMGFAERFRDEIARIERLYLEELMSTADAKEGLRAFVEKRPAQWSNR